MSEVVTVAEIFRRAQEYRRQHSDASYKHVEDWIAREFSSDTFPPLYNLTIPEQDARAPEEDWTAGLPIVRRGIQFKDWKEIAKGIVLSLEQTENYERERGPEGTSDKWHDRTVGIEEPTKRALSKWMPEELMHLAEQKSPNRK